MIITKMMKNKLMMMMRLKPYKLLNFKRSWSINRYFMIISKREEIKSLSTNFKLKFNIRTILVT